MLLHPQLLRAALLCCSSTVTRQLSSSAGTALPGNSPCVCLCVSVWLLSVGITFHQTRTRHEEWPGNKFLAQLPSRPLAEALSWRHNLICWLSSSPFPHFFFCLSHPSVPHTHYTIHGKHFLQKCSLLGSLFLLLSDAYVKAATAAPHSADGRSPNEPFCGASNKTTTELKWCDLRSEHLDCAARIPFTFQEQCTGCFFHSALPLVFTQTNAI